MAKGYRVNKWAFIFLRVILAFIFIVHGYQKLFGGLDGTTGFFASIGIPLAGVAALVVAVLEFFGGILLLFGLFQKWIAALLTIQMLVAFLLVHLKNGFSVGNGGYEFVILIIASLILVTNKK